MLGSGPGAGAIVGRSCGRFTNTAIRIEFPARTPKQAK
jgi:hypothetical protein